MFLTDHNYNRSIILSPLHLISCDCSVDNPIFLKSWVQQCVSGRRWFTQNRCPQRQDISVSESFFLQLVNPQQFLTCLGSAIVIVEIVGIS